MGMITFNYEFDFCDKTLHTLLFILSSYLILNLYVSYVNK